MKAAIHPEVRIGHVHLTVSNLERAINFYRDALGFEITQRHGGSAVFLSAGGYHHHIGLNIWAGEGAPQPPPGRTGLYHFAILYPNRLELARAFKRLFDHGIPIEGASDHGVSEAIYLRDPDGNGIELYRDRPQSEWPRVNGELRMTTAPLDLDGLLAELHESAPKQETQENQIMTPAIEVNEATFDRDVLQSPRPVVVDFWADWCGPCKMLALLLDEVAREQQAHAAVAKVNIDANPTLAARFDIQSIPTLLYFSGGEVRDKSVGVVSKKTIVTKLDALRPESNAPTV
ncbi:MAG TPA: thioredoxin [Candidatus Acidoferrum sp.]|nr:thioredoxin [Candidatus Acidoferrum sp.]